MAGRASLLTGISALALALACAGSAAFAQSTATTTRTLNDRLAAAGSNAQNGKARLLVDADQMVFDRDNDRVTAKGNVQLYYQGRTLEADSVTYDRKTKRVFAKGNARLTEANGVKYFGDTFELTDDFKDGFIDSLRVETEDKQRFSAARAERQGGQSTVFERGTYTACEPCKNNPEKPPLWQVRAARIIHNNDERTIYYENAALEFYGVPVAYIPFFSAPDPTVTRKSGFLSPHFVSTKALGYGASIPYFWAIAPNYDVTLTPTFMSRQGVLGQAEWRHRLSNGQYNIRLAGIVQQDKKAFLTGSFGAGDRDFRGSAETTGKFFINDKWSFGWDAVFTTDKYFLSNYKIRSESLGSTFFKESVSTAYLTGQGERSFFDLRGYYIAGQTSNDWQKQLPVVHPVLDYDRRFDTPLIGGELAVKANITSLSREAADYQAKSSGTGSLLSAPIFVQNGTGLFTGCASYTADKCLLRGFAGTYARATAEVSWRRQFIDPLGQVWTPFGALRTDVASYDVNTTSLVQDPGNVSVYGNDKQVNFIDPGGNSASRTVPLVGLEYRYPFIAVSNWGTHQIEPIAQVIARPNETRIGKLPNEDAQSLVFDDTTLFAWNKFSGYDRTEGGTRLNYGVQYSWLGEKAYANALVGQSVHLAGRNSYARGDTSNTGLDSGLETRRSDYVGRISVAPVSNLSFTGRGRFDEDTFALKRLEIQSTATYGGVSLSATYARIAPQPALGYDLRREGLATSASVQLPANWRLSGSVLFDLDRYLTDRQSHLANPALYPTYDSNPFRVASTSVGLGYKDECTDFSVIYARSVSDFVTGTKQSGHTVLFRLELKNLGDASYQLRTGSAANNNDVSLAQ